MDKAKHHKTKAPKPKVTSSSTCPSAALLSTAGGTTYSAPVEAKGANPNSFVCTYDTSGEVSLLVSLYEPGQKLSFVDANAAGPVTKISGIGNAAAHFGTIVFVQLDSARSFSVIDQTGSLTLSQTEAEAKAIVNG